MVNELAVTADQMLWQWQRMLWGSIPIRVQVRALGQPLTCWPDLQQPRRWCLGQLWVFLPPQAQPWAQPWAPAGQCAVAGRKAKRRGPGQIPTGEAAEKDQGRPELDKPSGDAEPGPGATARDADRRAVARDTPTPL